MARQAGNDRDIYRLNKTSHYVGVADFERPRLQMLRRVSHTLPPLDAIVSYLAETGFGDTVPLRYHPAGRGVPPRATRTQGPSWGCLRDFDRWYHTETWALVEQLHRARPSVTPQQAAQRKESFTLKLVWLQDRVHQMPLQTTRRPSNSTPVSGVVLGLGRAGLDVPVTVFGGTVGCHGHHRLHSVVDVLDLPKIFSVMLVGLQQQSRDQHEAKALCPPWFLEEEEWGTWLSVVPLVCFNIVQFYQVDRVKRQFNGEQ
ncbi:uncharacterized protein DS421_7g219900 [Arachis hypogaea]|nr:uncharacterized protein DS421_7g219900 [Arachis hypogaea]